MSEECHLSVCRDVAECDNRKTVRVGERNQKDDEVGRADVLDDGPEEAGKLNLASVVHGCEGHVFVRVECFCGDCAGGASARIVCFTAPEHETEDDRLNHANEYDEERTAPEIEFVNSTGGKTEYGDETSDESDCADCRHGFFAGEFQVVFAETDERLDDGNGACDAREEQHGEPNGLEESAKRKRPENVRHRLETETEGAELCTFFDVCSSDDHSNRDDDRTADDDFGKAVRAASGKRRKGEVFLGLQVTGVAEHNAHAEAHGEEYLACSCHPNLGVRKFGKVRVPHEGEALADSRERKHAGDEDKAEDEQNRHANLVRAFNALAHTETEHGHVGCKCDEEEDDGYGNSADACLEHDVVAEEFRHLFWTLGHYFHQGSRCRVEGECENPGLDEPVVEDDENRRNEGEGTEVLGPPFLLVENDMEGTRACAVAVVSAIAAERPFDPGKGNA